MPWYFDEQPAPNPLPPGKNPYSTSYSVAANTTTSQLKYEDVPNQPLGTTLTYNTFLIADYGDRTYRPLGDGFEWSVGVKPIPYPDPKNPYAGFTYLTSEPKAVKYDVTLFDDLISEFGYSRRKDPLNLACPGGNGTCSDGYYYTDLIGGGIGASPTGYSPNDDSSFGAYPLGFPLAYFGQTYNDFYVNNNGNVSFGNPVGAYTPTPLNTESSAPIIAPYWADVDTRGTGTVSMRTDIPNQVIVTWDKVGYFSQHTDKLADIQLVLRGPDFLVPPNEGNVGFFYKNVQWETGDASGGSDGFGGTPAGVGFSDGLSTVDPGDRSLPGSQQPGISQLVNNNYYWFNYPSSASGSGNSGGGDNGGGGGDCTPGSGGGGCENRAMAARYFREMPSSDSDRDRVASIESGAIASSEAVPEPHSVGILAVGAWGILQRLKKSKSKQP